MIDFTIKHQDEQEGGLSFQIARKFEDCLPINPTTDRINFKDSVVIKEEAFSLVESCFASEFSVNDRNHIYYHYGVHLHNKKSIEKIIDKLLEKKNEISNNGVDIEEYYWFTEDIIEYLNNNKFLIYEFIDNLNSYLKASAMEKHNQGIYVIGI